MCYEENAPGLTVALLAEGVDRNCVTVVGCIRQGWSPSSRRAWIEIFQPPGRPVHLPVALLAEGVDRNHSKSRCIIASGESPSSRRAWIEIILVTVELLDFAGRPPRGGRG